MKASKSAARPTQQVVRWIRKSPQYRFGLDYGCRELRYARELAKKCSRLTLVDSIEHLDRPQMIDGRKTTLREYASVQWRHARVLSIEEFEMDKRRYDFALCANVLSEIPEAATRDKVVRRITQSLSAEGRALFVTHLDSRVLKPLRSGVALRHLDGWIIQTSKGVYYIGLLPLEKLRAIITENGGRILEAWSEGDAAFVLASREP